MPSPVRDLVDELDVVDVTGLIESVAPCVTFYLPAGRTKEDAQRAPLELRALLDEADALLRDAYPAETSEQVLGAVRGLLDDREFWNRQGEGLAVFASADGMRVMRLSHEPARRVSVGEHPHLVPLIDTIDHHFGYHLLALSQGKVRLFEGTWSSLEPLDLGPVPASIEDMERRHESEPELQHQHQPASRGTATFHGHGGRNVAEVAADKFVLEVAAGVRARLGAASTTPLYLAAVGEYLPRLQATGQLPTLRERMITGNPDALAAHELHERVRELVTADAGEVDEALRGELDRATGAGRLAVEQGDVARAATEGRVDRLVVDPSADAGSDARIDELVAKTLQQGGRVSTLRELPDEVPAVAVLRY